MNFLLWACQVQSNTSLESEPCLGWAASLGPGLSDCQARKRRHVYGPSVMKRASMHPNEVWDERIRLYQEGLMTKRWTQTADGDGSHDQQIRDESTIHCPVTVIFGLDDIAIDPRNAVDGIERFIDRSAKATSSGRQCSHAILLPGVGHWSPRHPRAVAILEDVLNWQLEARDTETGTTTKAHKGGSEYEDQGLELRIRKHMDDVQVEIRLLD